MAGHVSDESLCGIGLEIMATNLSLCIWHYAILCHTMRQDCEPQRLDARRKPWPSLTYGPHMSPLLGFRSAFEACLASGAKSELMYLSNPEHRQVLTGSAGMMRGAGCCCIWRTYDGGYVCNKHIHWHTHIFYGWLILYIYIYRWLDG